MHRCWELKTYVALWLYRERGHVVIWEGAASQVCVHALVNVLSVYCILPISFERRLEGNRASLVLPLALTSRMCLWLPVISVHVFCPQ